MPLNHSISLAAGQEMREFALDGCLNTFKELERSRETCTKVAATLDPAFTNAEGGWEGHGMWARSALCELIAGALGLA